MDPDFDDDRALRDVHRAASEVRDERPASRVRAAVLAEAAKGAGPRGFGVRHWPQSLAAVLVVSVMTGLVFTHVLREEPARLGPVADVPAPSTAAPSAPLGPAPTSIVPDVQSFAKTASPPTAAARPDTPPAGAARAKQRAVPDGVDRQRALETEGRDAAPGRSISATLPSNDEAALAVPAAAPPPPPADRNARMAPAAARNAAVAAAPESAESIAPARKAGDPADVRMQRILALRRAGHDDEADRALAQWRADFPDVAPPPEAFRSTVPR